MSYLYETHLHTAGVSTCATSRGAEYIKAYLDKGYTGIIVTDHFYNGNTSLPKKLPWKEWVNRFCRGYEEAREEGERRGLDVFFGWEETFDGCDDYLVFGLDKAWLLDHPECRYWTRGEQYSAVKEAGGCVVQAHPFRQYYYISKIVLSAGCVDGVEAANNGNDNPSFDALAYRYAKKIGKTITAGTDIHDVSSIYSGSISGVYFNRRLKNIKDFSTAILNNETAGIKTTRNFNLNCASSVTIPVEIRDGNDRITGKKWRDYI
jgi:hypothetical protein